MVKHHRLRVRSAGTVIAQLHIDPRDEATFADVSPTAAQTPKGSVQTCNSQYSTALVGDPTCGFPCKGYQLDWILYRDPDGALAVSNATVDPDLGLLSKSKPDPDPGFWEYDDGTWHCSQLRHVVHRRISPIGMCFDCATSPKISLCIISCSARARTGNSFCSDHAAIMATFTKK